MPSQLLQKPLVQPTKAMRSRRQTDQHVTGDSMNAQNLRRRAWTLAACTLTLALSACGASTGGGGGAYVAKDGTTGDVAKADATATDATTTDDMATQDMLAMDIQMPGSDVLAVEILDTPDVQQDIKKVDVTPDVAKQDTTTPSSCIAKGTCDPVANTCPNAGEACDISTDGSSGCFPPPNDVGPGGKCDNTNGPFCQGGYHCGPNATCQKFCCSADDCASGKACTPFGAVPTDAIGLSDP